MLFILRPLFCGPLRQVRRLVTVFPKNRITATEILKTGNQPTNGFWRKTPRRNQARRFPENRQSAFVRNSCFRIMKGMDSIDLLKRDKAVPGSADGQPRSPKRSGVALKVLRNIVYGETGEPAPGQRAQAHAYYASSHPASRLGGRAGKHHCQNVCGPPLRSSRWGRVRERGVCPAIPS